MGLVTSYVDKSGDARTALRVSVTASFLIIIAVSLVAVVVVQLDTLQHSAQTHSKDAVLWPYLHRTHGALQVLVEAVVHPVLRKFATHAGLGSEKTSRAALLCST